jgi:hypothetical protein
LSNSATLLGTPGEGPKHHYIPVFYTKRWAGTDGRLCEYSRPYRQTKPRRVHPDATGYVRGLYTIPGVPPEIAEHLERRFLLYADSAAADALNILLSDSPFITTSTPRSAWSRFMLSLMLRNPEYVARLSALVADQAEPMIAEFRARYNELKRPGDPDTFEEYQARSAPNLRGRATVTLLQRLMDSLRMGGHLNQMNWAIIRFSNFQHHLLTSDRPILMTNGLIGPQDHVAIPISPSVLFVATNNAETERMIRSIRSADLNAPSQPPRCASGAQVRLWRERHPTSLCR